MRGDRRSDHHGESHLEAGLLVDRGELVTLPFSAHGSPDTRSPKTGNRSLGRRQLDHELGSLFGGGEVDVASSCLNQAFHPPKGQFRRPTKFSVTAGFSPCEAVRRGIRVSAREVRVLRPALRWLRAHRQTHANRALSCSCWTASGRSTGGGRGLNHTLHRGSRDPNRQGPSSTTSSMPGMVLNRSTSSGREPCSRAISTSMGAELTTTGADAERSKPSRRSRDRRSASVSEI